MGKSSGTNDMTDAFDMRLKAIDRPGVPRAEVDAAITVYERVRTARSICQALMPQGFSDAAVVALTVELGLVRQSGQSVKSGE